MEKTLQKHKSLSAVFSQHALAVTDASSDYKANVSSVSNEMVTVFTTSLPPLNQTPANWAIVQADLTDAKVVAQKWTNQIYAQLLETPEDIEAMDSAINMFLSDAASNAAILAAPPDGTTQAQLNAYKAALTSDLKQLQNKFQMVLSFVSGLEAAIISFGAQLPETVDKLSDAAADAYTDQDIDQAKIDSLRSEINNLNNEIIGLEVSLGIESAALVGTVAAGVAVATVPGLGWLATGACVVAALGESAAIALTAIQLKEDQDKLDSLYGQLTLVEQDAAALQITADNFVTLSEGTDAVESSVSAINAAWQPLSDDLDAAINDILAALNEENDTPVDYVAIEADIADAQSEWEATYLGAVSLELDVQASDATLTVGMTSDQVQAAVDSSTTTDIITYVNNYNAA